MTETHAFDTESAKRIARTVLGWEGRDVTTPLTQKKRRHTAGGGAVKLGFAPADVNDGASASFDLAKGPVGAPVEWDAGVETITAYNITGRRIYNNQLCFLIPIFLHDVGKTYYAEPAVHKTSRIRGLANGAMTAGTTTGAIDGIVGIDGPAENTSESSVHLPTANEDIADNEVVWADWSYVNHRWEISGADCPA